MSLLEYTPEQKRKLSFALPEPAEIERIVHKYKHIVCAQTAQYTAPSGCGGCALEGGSGGQCQKGGTGCPTPPP